MANNNITINRKANDPNKSMDQKSERSLSKLEYRRFKIKKKEGDVSLMFVRHFIFNMILMMK